MARYRDANCKLCRREKEKLFLKGKRCYTEKCSFERREYAPGEHGESTRRKISQYGIQLREKQKARKIYGLLEQQFRNYFHKAEKEKGITGENLLRMLECRLDNLVYRLGFAPSRKAGRQLVLHGHFLVGNRKVNIPSYQVKVGQIISVREESRNLEVIHSALREAAADLPWLRLDKARLEGELSEKPKRSDIPSTIQEQLIVELYSK